MNKLFGFITNWYFSRKALPYWCVLFFDCSIVMFAGLISAYMMLGGATWSRISGMWCRYWLQLRVYLRCRSTCFIRIAA